MAVRILIVEDEPIVALDIARGLKLRGYDQVEIVNTAEDAVKVAQAHPPDLVLMDISLRGGDDGIEAARQIGLATGIPVVYLTERADVHTTERAKTAQPHGYLVKPFGDAELHDAVEKALPKPRGPRASETEAAASFFQSGERFRLLVESLPDYAVFLLDCDGHLRSCNPAGETLYGYAGETLLGQPFAMLHALRAVREGRPGDILSRAATTGSFHGEEWHRRKNGADFWADVSVTALRSNEHAVVGFAAVVRDLTERKEAEEAIKQLNAALEQRVTERTQELARVNQELEAFTYSVAHDLRAPLRGIFGYLDALHEDHAREIPAPALAYLQRSLECATRMQVLMDDLVKLSRIGRQELQHLATPLNRIATEVIAVLATENKNRQIEWRVSELPTLFCDPLLVRQVFTHLLSNAVKYTRRQSSAVVDVYHETRDSEHVIIVKDNGVGFDMKRASNLFTPFFRLHTQQEFEGAGMGLAITDRIVRRHHGRIWAEAEVEKGATFSFTLGGQN